MKYILLSIFFLNSQAIFSMEETKIEINEKTKLLDFKPKSLAASQDKDLNKISLDEFIKKLPKEIWEEIRSFLKYEDNKKFFRQIWASKFPVDDLVVQKIAIDFFRNNLINSRSLSSFEKEMKNNYSFWKNKDNAKLVDDYLKILFKNFLNKNKDLDFSGEDFSTIISNFTGKNKNELVLKFLNYKMQELNFSDDFSIDRKKQFRLGVFEFNEKKDVQSNFFHSSIQIRSKAIRLTIVNAFSLLVMALAIYLLVEAIITEDPPNRIAYWIAFGVTFFSAGCCLGQGIFCTKNFLCNEISSIKIKSNLSFFIKLNKEIKEYLKKNNLDLSCTDNYFLKLLGHDNCVEDITNLNYV